MAEASYEVFLPEVLPYAVGVPHPTAVNAIRNAVLEFLRQTHYLQHDFGEIYISAGESEIELDIPTDYEVVSVKELHFDGKALRPASELALRSRQQNSWKSYVGPPQMYVQDHAALVTLVPVPDVGGTLTGVVAITPTIRSTTVDDSIPDGFLEDIAAGAISRLLMLPNEPFSNAQHALVYRRRFDEAIKAAQIEKNASSVNAPMRVQLSGGW